MPQPKFEIYKDAAGKFRWRLKAPDGQIIASSEEAHESKKDLKRELEDLKQSARHATVRDLTKEIHKDVKSVMRVQKSQEKESLKSFYSGVLLWAVLGVIGNFFVSFWFQPMNTPTYVGLVVCGTILLLMSIALIYKAKKSLRET